MKLDRIESKYPLEKIYWRDILGKTSWTSLKKVAGLQPASCISVGYIISEDDDIIRVAGSMSNDRDVSNIDVIPKSVITRRVPLIECI